MASLEQPTLHTTAPATANPPSQPPQLFIPASLAPRLVPAAPLLETLPINVVQLNKAVNALVSFVGKKAEKDDSLLGEVEEKVYLVIGLVKPAAREVHKPVQFRLPHPVLDPKSSPITLFVKDPQREYKDLLESSSINFIERVIGLDKLRNKHKTFEAKRLLIKAGELFLVDDRVMTEVGNALGKQFRQVKKQPVPVSLVRKDLKGELERAVASTYLQISMGTSLSLKIGSTSLHSPQDLVDNLKSVIPQLAVKLPQGGWSNIQSLHLKTTTSISLPLYNTTLDAQGRFAGPSEEDVKARAGKQEAKDVVLKAKTDKVAAREERRVEREAEKEKREKLQKQGGKEERKERKRKAKAEAGENESSITGGASSAGGAGEETEEVSSLALDQPIVQDSLPAPKVKKSKKVKV